MEPLVLSANWSLSQIERSMLQILDAEGAPLQVQKGFIGKRHGALHDAARLQLLATWARQARERYLLYHPANSTEAIIDELSSYAPGISVLRMCDGVAVGDDRIGRRDALQKSYDKMLARDQLDLRRVVNGRTIDFPCVSGSRLQYLSPLFFERNEHAVKSKQDMLSLLTRLSAHVSQVDTDRIPENFLRACAVFANELIKNTQEHASRDHAGKPYVEHVEGLIISWYEMTRDLYEEDFQSHPRLREFWLTEQAPIRGGSSTALRGLQLSFFDTGPGFASRATGRPLAALSLAQERSAVIESLRKNTTTKTETGAGNGIPEVLETLREVGGLITIRTGRLRIFRAFSPGEPGDAFQFENWSNEELAPSVGSTVSIILPIRR